MERMARMVATSRCNVPARVQRAEPHGRATHALRCAAERGADGAARRPYHSTESRWDSVGAGLCPHDQSQRRKGEKVLESFSRLLCSDLLRLTEPRSMKKRR